MNWIAFLALLAYIAAVLIGAGILADWLDPKTKGEPELTRHSGNTAGHAAWNARRWAQIARREALAHDVHVVEGEGA